MDLDECREEQRNELEALESIYAELFEASGERAFRLVVEADADAAEDGQSHAAVQLAVEYPERYPEEPPSIALERVRGALTQADVDETLAPLAVEAAGEAAGEVCVFLVVEALREWLDEHNEPELSMHEQMLKRAEAGAAEDAAAADAADAADAAAGPAEEEEEKYVALAEPGAPVTPESFAAWKLAFEQQQAAIREQNKTAKERSEEEARQQRPTGRQLFERNLELGVVDGAAGAGDIPTPDEVFFFSKAVYGEGADEDLPSTDSSDEDEA